MKITRIKVTGYKNLVDCEINLESINVLIGANNSGKSNLLEIFGFLNLLIYGNDNERKLIFENNFLPSYGDYKSFCSSENETKVELDYIIHVNNEITYKYFYKITIKNATLDKSITTNSGYIKEESFSCKNIKKTGTPKLVFKRLDEEKVRINQHKKDIEIDKTVSVVSIIQKLKDLKEGLDHDETIGLLTLQLISHTNIIYNSPNEIRSSFGENDFYIIKHGRIASLNLKNELVKIIKSDFHDFFSDIIRDFLGINSIILKEFALDTEKSLSFIFFESPNGILQTPTQLSDGSLIVLNILTYLFVSDIESRSSIIVIEELENSLHPRLLQKLLTLMRNNFSNRQIIITSHSPVLLNMVQINEVNLFVSKEWGNTEIVKVNDRKDLVRKLSQPLSSFGDIFFMTENTYEES